MKYYIKLLIMSSILLLSNCSTNQGDFEKLKDINLCLEQAIEYQRKICTKQVQYYQQQLSEGKLNEYATGYLSQTKILEKKTDSLLSQLAGIKNQVKESGAVSNQEAKSTLDLIKTFNTHVSWLYSTYAELGFKKESNSQSNVFLYLEDYDSEASFKNLATINFLSLLTDLRYRLVKYQIEVLYQLLPADI